MEGTSTGQETRRHTTPKQLDARKCCHPAVTNWRAGCRVQQSCRRGTRTGHGQGGDPRGLASGWAESWRRQLPGELPGLSQAPPCTCARGTPPLGQVQTSRLSVILHVPSLKAGVA